MRCPRRAPIAVPHRELLPAAVDPGEQEVRQVDAGDRQDARHRSRQDEEGRPEASPQRIVERRDPGAERAAVVDRLLELLADDAQVGLRLVGRDARLEAPDAEERVAPPRRLRRNRKRRDQVNLVAGREDRVEVEGLPHHADDRHGGVVQRQRAADDRRVAVEAALPERVAEDGDRRAVEPALLGGEVAPERQRHAEHVEEVVRHADRPQPGRIAGAGQRRPARRNRRTRNTPPGPRSSCSARATR